MLYLTAQQAIIGLASFALLTLLFIVMSLFTSLTEPSLNVSSTSRAKLGTLDFRTTVESLTGSTALSHNDSIEMFTDGSLFLEDLLEEIVSSTQSVTITNYIFTEGEMTNRTFDALIARAKEGVAIRLLLDAHGASKAPEDKLLELEKSGGKVARFRPVNFRTLTRIHRRTHVRAIVIDGKSGYTGGMAFQDEWLGDGVGEKEWRDAMFKYRGPLARATQNHFNALWRQTDGEILSGPKFYPRSEVSETGSPDLYFISLFHAPAPDVSADLLDLIWLTITGAEERILLSTPYLTPPEEILKALREAVKRGVVVEVLVPGPHTDTRLIQSATRSYYQDLLEAGVKIYEYQAGRFHEKFLVADSHWSLIGSANMDNRSASLNVENVFGIEDRDLAEKLEKEFATNKLLSLERTTENFQPNIFKKTYYRVIALFTKQM